ncbi:methyltransferase [Pseudoalteromonas sp. NBT06-2]|nr:methyltransferase [Pseudoalteromonas sp. NBT06-2]
MLNEVDLIRIAANEKLDPKKKGELGQFYTAAPISMFMASLFESMADEINLLDPGCGPCSLAAAFTDEAIKRGNVSTINIDAHEIEERIKSHIVESVNVCEEVAKKAGIKLNPTFHFGDFIQNFSNDITNYSDCEAVFGPIEHYSHIIMNPPYKKIASSSDHRKWLRAVGIETVNLYSAFVAIALKRLKQGGELVAIIPRSFCNGPYYQPFREQLINEAAIRHIHIFDSRSNAFSGDDVLQENIILHLVKGEEQREVTITSSPVADFHQDDESGTVTASDMTTRTVPFSSIVNPGDKQQFIHIAANNRDQSIIDKLSVFNSTLEDISAQVSTGPVVDFRLKDDLRKDIEPGAVPLIYPVHLNGGVNWPKESKKPNAISVSDKSKSWLWKHEGYFVIVRRFSSKEEKRRIVATPYDSSLAGELIGFENKLNVFHSKKVGLDRELALGLYVYLNCTLLDKYYRLFGGHTQVNATDLRTIHYPEPDTLRRIGAQVQTPDLTQKEIDQLIEREISQMTGVENNNPLSGQEKIDQALEVITLLGMPRAQQNERSALTFLTLLNLHPEGSWQELEKPLFGVTPIMDWCRDVYGKEYAPNTRETFRRQTLHQFVDGGLALYNPDKPDRPVNSPKACYQIAPELFEVLLEYGTASWEKALKGWLKLRKTLAQQYAMEREMQMIPLTLDDGTEIKLSPGIHSQLIHDIVIEFGPRFAPGSEVIYLGDTGAKEDFFRKDRLAELGVTVDRKGKLPDVVLYWPERDWLLLIESVTSHGPVDGKRHGELAKLFKDSKPGLVYVTAFPDRKIMGKYLGEISWETEVWMSEAPTHMIHFNGDRFLGPHD